LVYLAKGSKLPGTIPSVAGSLLTELAASYDKALAAAGTGSRARLDAALDDMGEARSEAKKYVDKYIRTEGLQLPPGVLTTV
jgi:hypothetical protein